MSRLVSTYGDFDVSVPDIRGGEIKKIKCDVVIIGGGGSGLSAAVRCAQKGLEVIIIDKMSVLGGNTRLAGGLLVTSSSILKKKGIHDTTDSHIKKYLSHHLYRIDRDIVTRFIKNTGVFYDWMAKLGMDTENHRIVMDNVVMIKDRKDMGPLRNPAYGPGLMGTEVTDTLIAAAERYGVTVFKETQAKELVVKDGGICGVKAEGNGYNYEIECQNAVLSSGGFGRDTKLLKKYFPEYFSSDNYFTHYCLAHCTGDGLFMAQKAGAKTGENMSFGLESMVHIPGAHSLQRVMQEPIGIIVSSIGKRFVPEDDIENGEFLLDEQPDGIAWYLFNDKLKDYLYELALEHRRYGDWMPDYDEYHNDIKSEIENGLMIYGNTISELADAMGAPADVLENTIKNYEIYCRNKRDEELYKDPEYLVDMGEDGPWYGIRLLRKFDVTMGGVSINKNMEVLRPDGSIIKGLYAAGDIASGWMGPDYGPLFSSFAWAVNSGFLAAESISRST
ncbi:MAG: FAD-dependent oxidoreductase [Eubacterium sp.]|nr:FAD-dependent oxidoreductase [Eubacterium sp.]